jgi:DNA-binding transcriptional LysR family regulator
MEIETLRTFVEVMRRGSFAAVARELDVDPSTVSRAIGTLEQQLDVRLFQRTTRKLSPTEAALAYFDRVEPMIDELERAALVAVDSGDTPRGLLRVTAAVAFAQANLAPLLPEFAKRYPEVGLDLLLTDAFVDLVEQRIDIAVRLGRVTDSSFIAYRLAGMVYAVCASPDYLKRRGRPNSPADLARHDCLRYRYPNPGYGPRWRFRMGDDEPFDVPVRGPIAASSGGVLRQCAVAGMGVVLLPRWIVAEELASGALVELLTNFRASPADFDNAIWLLYPSRSYLPLKVRVFADFLKAKFKLGPPAETALGRPGRRR